MMWNKIGYGFAIAFIVIVLGLLGFGLYEGEKIDHITIDMIENSDLEENALDCENYHQDVLHTETKYNAFVEDCAITLENDIDFSEYVVGVYMHQGSGDNVVTSFYKGYFKEENQTIINYQQKFTLLNCKCAVWEVYLVLIPKRNDSNIDVEFKRIY